MKKLFFIVVICALITTISCTRNEENIVKSSPNDKPKAFEFIGKSFVYDYGQIKYKVDFISKERLRWTVLDGDEKGKNEEENLSSSEIRPNIYYNSWQEKDGYVVSQVVDFEQMKVTTVGVLNNKVDNYSGKISISSGQ